MSNPLKDWFDNFVAKRKAIVKLRGLRTPEEIADYFTYENMRKNHPDFCPLYKTNRKCHDLSDKELVCYFCACPYYDYEYYDEEKKEYGRCKINSKYGKRNKYGYWDCSDCLLPHRKKFVEIYLKKHGIDDIGQEGRKCK